MVNSINANQPLQANSINLRANRGNRTQETTGNLANPITEEMRGSLHSRGMEHPLYEGQLTVVENSNVPQNQGINSFLDLLFERVVDGDTRQRSLDEIINIVESEPNRINNDSELSAEDRVHERNRIEKTEACLKVTEWQ